MCTLGGWGIGYLVGEGIIFTTPVIWWINILKFFVQLPLLWICCGGTAGWCTPERRRTVPQEETKAAAALARTVGEGEDAGVTVDADVYWNRGRTLKWDPIQLKTSHKAACERGFFIESDSIALRSEAIRYGEACVPCTDYCNALF